MLRHHLICLALLLATGPALPDSPPAPAALEAPAAPEPRAAPAAPAAAAGAPEDDDPPEGYYAFVESPNATPPRVRPPPYRQTGAPCAATPPRPQVSAHNLCGDLNRGLIPDNPMGHRLNGEPYPFELIRNLTLRFLSRTLPVLRADDTLPRVTHVAAGAGAGAGGETTGFQDHNRITARHKRDTATESQSQSQSQTADKVEARESRKFCDNGGVFCMLYRAINGEPSPAAGSLERREDPGAPPPAAHAAHPAAVPRYETAPRPPPPSPLAPPQGPPTPCPARVEYATPVFARNYQGVWRYVVQIPYEGYFTQTIEVTRCMQSRCHYLDGGCLSSPRWVSLLVAELHYPPAAPAPAPAPSAPAPAQPADFQEYQQYLQKRAGTAPGAGAGGDAKPTHCDGHDEMGCFQVRLYYDWFLVPGSCKCWRPDYFARYVRRRHSAGEL